MDLERPAICMLQQQLLFLQVIIVLSMPRRRGSRCRQRARLRTLRLADSRPERHARLLPIGLVDRGRGRFRHNRAAFGRYLLDGRLRRAEWSADACVGQLLFDCTSPEAAMAAVQRLGFTPLDPNHSIILAVNPNGV